MSDDDSVKEFYDRLEEATFTLQDLMGEKPSAELRDFRVFRAQCEERERAGRGRWGDQYLARDNCTEATEEGADLANYNMFDILQARHYNEEEDWAIALTAARHAFLAHRYSRALRAKRHEQYSDAQTA